MSRVTTAGRWSGCRLQSTLIHTALCDSYGTTASAVLKGRKIMWLTLIVVGLVLLVFGVLVEAAQFLIWLGIVILVVSAIMSLIGRSRR